MIKRYKYLFFLVLVAVVFTGCGGGGGTTYYGNIVGTVFYQDTGEPVVNAEIVIARRSTHTNRDGQFRLDNIPADAYTLTIRHPSILNGVWTEGVTIPSNSTRSADFGVPRNPDSVGGTGYYIVIGVDYPSGPSPMSPRYDARAVYEDLYRGNELAGGGRLLVSSGGQGTLEPTKSNIRSSIDEAIKWARNRNSDDYLVIYFSGDSGQNHLKDRNGTWITDGELEEWVRTFPGPVTLILDGNESFTFVDGEELSAQAFKKWDYTVLAGTLERQSSGATENSDLSWFTYHLLRGVTTRSADYNRDGDITASELYRYTDEAMKLDVHQTPFLKPGYYADSVVYRYKR